LKQLSFDKLIYVGIRDIDDFEAETIKKYNIRHYTPQQAIDFMRENSQLPIHISFDVDALDPIYISSTGTRVENGLHPHEVREIIVEALRVD